MPLTCNMNCDKDLDVIYKGTTPTFNFNVCLDMSLVDKANTHIIFTSGPAVVDKSGDDITIEGENMSCSLTQQDTLSFKGNQANIQILVSMTSGQKPASSIMTIPVSATLRGDEPW